MSLGLVGAFGQQALRDSIKQRLIEEQQAKQRAFENSIESRRMANAEQQTLQGGEQNKFNAEALAFSRGETAANNRLTQTRALNEATPPGDYPLDNPVMPQLEKIGAATKDSGTLASTELGGMSALPGPTSMPQGRLTMIPQPAKQGRYVKLPSEKQQMDATTRSDKLADNARADKALAQQGETQDWRNSIAQQLADVKAGQQPAQSYQVQPELDATGKQTGRFFGYNTKSNRWEPVQGAGPGSTKAAPGAAAEATNARTLKETQDTLTQLDQAIENARSLIGPGRGQISNIEQMVGSADPKIQALGVKMKAAKMRVDHALTGSVRAGASPTLLAQWDNILANKVTPEGLKAGVQALREILTPAGGESAGGGTVEHWGRDANGRPVKVK